MLERLASCLYFNTEAMQLITNPLKHLGRMWVASRYVLSRPSKLKSLMRMKAMCLIYQFPACPILAAYCEMILRLTSGYDISKLYEQLDPYDRERFSFLLRTSDIPKVREPISDLTRLTVQNLFGLDPVFQERMEAYFDSITSWSQTISPPGHDLVTPKAWLDNWHKYVVEIVPSSYKQDPGADFTILPVRRRFDADTEDKSHEALLTDHRLSLDEIYSMVGRVHC